MALTAPLAGLLRFRRRLVSRIASAAFGIVLLIWTLLPVYNMLLVALDEDGDEFTGAIWPANPNLDGFAALWNEDSFLLEHFWYRFGNSIKMGLATMMLTVLIGSLASFVLGRMRLRGSRVIGDLALLNLRAADSVSRHSFRAHHAQVWIDRQPVVGHCLPGCLRHTLCGPDPASVR
jgi:ABC-type spermidine/putrescine transport system permease subunit II